MSSFENPFRFNRPESKTEQLNPAEIFGIVDPEDVYKPERIPVVEHYIGLSDIHNDLKSAIASLERSGITDNDGEWLPDVSGIHLVVTGDSINKQNPDTSVLKLLRHLKRKAPLGCEVTVLVGNHELDLLTREAQEKSTGLKNKHIEFLAEFGVVHKKGPVLFTHRYPTEEMLEEMVQQYEEFAGDVDPSEWLINERFTQAVATMKDSPEESVAVFEECNYGGESGGIYGQTEAGYYQAKADRIKLLLAKLGVTTIVHGHKKQISGGQKFENYLPGICMINIDAAIADEKNPDGNHRIGFVDVKVREDGSVEASSKYKNKIGKGKLKTQDVVTSTSTIN